MSGWDWTAESRIGRRIITGVLQGGLVLIMGAGCATKQPPPYEPRVASSPVPAVATRDAIPAGKEMMTGELITFGKLLTVIQSREIVIKPDGQEEKTVEIKPVLESELVKRDFRIFSGLVPPDSDVAALTRQTKAQMLISVEAKSEFVNSSGRFSKYRAIADAKAIRGHDGTILASSRVEKMGPRNQDVDRAGDLALRAIAEPVTDELVQGLLAKTDQLLWAGLIVDSVPNMEMALQIQQGIESKPFVSYVELLAWDNEQQTATYEIIYGLKHESDVALLLQDIKGIRIRPSNYEPGRMEVLRNRISQFK